MIPNERRELENLKILCDWQSCRTVTEQWICFETSTLEKPFPFKPLLPANTKLLPLRLPTRVGTEIATNQDCPSGHSKAGL
jgi:hypothetical protein